MLFNRENLKNVIEWTALQLERGKEKQEKNCFKRFVVVWKGKIGRAGRSLGFRKRMKNVIKTSFLLSSRCHLANPFDERRPSPRSQNTFFAFSVLNTPTASGWQAKKLSDEKRNYKKKEKKLFAQCISICFALWLRLAIGNPISRLITAEETNSGKVTLH